MTTANAYKARITDAFLRKRWQFPLRIVVTPRAHYLMIMAADDVPVAAFRRLAMAYHVLVQLHAMHGQQPPSLVAVRQQLAAEQDQRQRARASARDAALSVERKRKRAVWAAGREAIAAQGEAFWARFDEETQKRGRVARHLRRHGLVNKTP